MMKVILFGVVLPAALYVAMCVGLLVILVRREIGEIKKEGGLFLTAKAKRAQREELKNLFKKTFVPSCLRVKKIGGQNAADESSG